MSYKSWTHRGGEIVVEKYFGDITFNDILKNDNEILANYQPGVGKLLVLTDVSEARLDDIPIERFEELFQAIDTHSEKTKGMQLALYTGMNRYEDFEKLGRYIDTARRKPYSVLLFNTIGIAMTWLGLSDEEQDLIEIQLREQ